MLTGDRKEQGKEEKLASGYYQKAKELLETSASKALYANELAIKNSQTFSDPNLLLSAYCLKAGVYVTNKAYRSGFRTQLDIAMTLYELKEYSDAKKFFRASLEKITNREDEGRFRDIAEVSFYLAKCCFELKESELARDYFGACLYNILNATDLPARIFRESVIFYNQTTIDILKKRAINTYNKVENLSEEALLDCIENEDDNLSRAAVVMLLYRVKSFDSLHYQKATTVFEKCPEFPPFIIYRNIELILKIQENQENPMIMVNELTNYKEKILEVNNNHYENIAQQILLLQSLEKSNNNFLITLVELLYHALNEPEKDKRNLGLQQYNALQEEKNISITPMILLTYVAGTCYKKHDFFNVVRYAKTAIEKIEGLSHSPINLMLYVTLMRDNQDYMSSVEFLIKPYVLSNPYDVEGQSALIHHEIERNSDEEEKIKTHIKNINYCFLINNTETVYSEILKGMKVSPMEPYFHFALKTYYERISGLSTYIEKTDHAGSKLLGMFKENEVKCFLEIKIDDFLEHGMIDVVSLSFLIGKNDLLEERSKKVLQRLSDSPVDISHAVSDITKARLISLYFLNKKFNDKQLARLIHSFQSEKTPTQDSLKIFSEATRVLKSDNYQAALRLCGLAITRNPLLFEMYYYRALINVNVFFCKKKQSQYQNSAIDDLMMLLDLKKSNLCLITKEFFIKITNLHDAINSNADDLRKMQQLISESIRDIKTTQIKINPDQIKENMENKKEVIKGEEKNIAQKNPKKKPSRNKRRKQADINKKIPKSEKIEANSKESIYYQRVSRSEKEAKKMIEQSELEKQKKKNSEEEKSKNAKNEAQVLEHQKRIAEEKEEKIKQEVIKKQLEQQILIEKRLKEQEIEQKRKLEEKQKLEKKEKEKQQLEEEKNLDKSVISGIKIPCFEQPYASDGLAVSNILKTLQDHKHLAYIVGGISRKIVNGENLTEKDDVDIVVTVSIDELKKIKEFEDKLIFSITDKSLAKIHLGNNNYAEIYYKPSLKKGLKEDARTRDFCRNTAYLKYTEEGYELYDPTGKAVSHIKAKPPILETPDEPNKMLLNNPLIALRGIFFQTRDKCVFAKSFNDALDKMFKAPHVETPFDFSKQDLLGSVDYWLDKLLKAEQWEENLNTLFEEGIFSKIFNKDLVVILKQEKIYKKFIAEIAGIHAQANTLKTKPITYIYARMISLYLEQHVNKNKKDEWSTGITRVISENPLFKSVNARNPYFYNICFPEDDVPSSVVEGLRQNSLFSATHSSLRVLSPVQAQVLPIYPVVIPVVKSASQSGS